MNNPWVLNDPPIVNKFPEEKPSWLTDEIKAQLEMNKLPVDQDGMLALHQMAKDKLSFWKETEMDYRKICVAFLVPEKTEGMNTVELGNGYQAKVAIKYNYKLAENDIVWSGLEKIEKLGNDGKFIAERLISWTPNFLLTEYRQLQEDAEKSGRNFAKEALKIIGEFLTITEAAPTLDIKEPKAKKK